VLLTNCSDDSDSRREKKESREGGASLNIGGADALSLAQKRHMEVWRATLNMMEGQPQNALALVLVPLLSLLF
tara:strand:+ start:140 stop:358 length:219 start_codon:yes stop_codon:yes gene_type:complete